MKGVNVTIPGELSRLLRTSTAFFSALLIGIGTLAPRHRRALARQHGDRRRLRAHPRLRRQARARRHRRPAAHARSSARRCAVSLWGVGLGVAARARPSAPRWTGARSGRASSSSTSRRASSSFALRLRGAAGRPRRRLRDASHRPAVARRGHSPGRVSRMRVRARPGLGRQVYPGRRRRRARARARRRGPRGRVGAGARGGRGVRLRQVHAAEPARAARARRRAARSGSTATA